MSEYNKLAETIDQLLNATCDWPIFSGTGEQVSFEERPVSVRQLLMAPEQAESSPDMKQLIDGVAKCWHAANAFHLFQICGEDAQAPLLTRLLPYLRGGWAAYDDLAAQGHALVAKTDEIEDDDEMARHITQVNAIYSKIQALPPRIEVMRDIARNEMEKSPELASQKFEIEQILENEDRIYQWQTRMKSSLGTIGKKLQQAADSAIVLGDPSVWSGMKKNGHKILARQLKAVRNNHQAFEHDIHTLNVFAFGMGDKTNAPDENERFYNERRAAAAAITALSGLNTYLTRIIDSYAAITAGQEGPDSQQQGR